MNAAGVRTITIRVLAVPLAGLYLVAGLGKFSPPAVEMFEGWGYAPWFAKLIGILEVAGAVGLLVPATTRPAICGLTVIMLAAVYTHLAAGEALHVLRPAAFLVVLWAIWWLGRRPAGTRSA